MSKQSTHSHIFSVKWPLFFWSGAIILLVVFPFFLLEIGLKSYLELKRQNQKDKIFSNLDKELGKLIQYKEPQHYYHSLLNLLFERANSTNKPITFLSKAIPHLKSHNIGLFKFIIWDKNKKIVSNLTDIKGYKYLKSIVFKTFQSVKNEVENNYPGSIDKIPIIKTKINLLRSFLGRFLLPEQLNYPYLKGRLGKCILSSSDSNKPYFWFHIGKQFSIFCTISTAANNAEVPLKKIVKLLNKNKDNPIKCGIAKLSSGMVLFTKETDILKREILIETGKFENIAQQKSETKNLLIVIKMLTPSLRGFAYVKKNDLLINVSQTKTRILVIFLIVLLILMVSFYLFMFKKVGIISVKWKLSILFLYANTIPLMILSFIGYAFLMQKQQLLISNLQKENAKFISSFDTEYPIVEFKIESKLNKEINRINLKYKDQKVPLFEQKKLEKIVLNLKAETCTIINRKGKFLIFSGSQKNRNTASFLKQSSINFLDVLNEKVSLNQHRYDEFSLRNGNSMSNLVKTDKILFNDLLARIGKIKPEILTNRVQLMYFNYFGSKSKRIFNSLMQVSWKESTLQEEYVKENIDSFNKNYQNIKCIALINSNGKTYPENAKITNSIQNLLGKSYSLKLAKADTISYNGNNFSAYGMVGKNLSAITLIALHPQENLISISRQIKIRLLLFCLMSLCLTIAIGKAIATLIIQPINELETGVIAIKKKSFRHRLSISSKDEFGQLGDIFNHALESLEDLEVAKVVQENLFPLKPIRQNKIEVFGRTVSMTRLGGDYYDFFSINNDETAVLIGDVAGHGVPAALLMAMAKASVLISDNTDKMDPAKLLSILHKVIYSTKSDTIKRMMTCQYFIFDSMNGNFTFSNAGHCFPALIQEKGQKVELIQAIGTPLGIKKKVKYNNVTHKLTPGDILLLYTDGIIEAKNKQGKEIGFTNFNKIIQNSYDENLEKYYHNIFRNYLNWGTSAEDDITMVLIKFAPNADS